MSNVRYIFGFHAITSRLRQHPESIREILFDAARSDQRVQEFIKLAERNHVVLVTCDHAKLTDIVSTDRHQGVVAKISDVQRPADLDAMLAELTGPVRLLILDGIQDPHNLGACLRVADAFGVHAVIAPKDRAVGLTPAVYKVASGAADTVPYFAVTNLARTMQQLKEHGVWIYGTSEDAELDLTHFPISGSVAWVFGSEQKGMRRLTRECCDQLVRIPMSGGIESLNVSVSAGICLFETHRQQSLA
ncbi:MAG: 23S rRNA (guanosine(2251)-2'-O)-methyltransferase RlmB [Nitrosomonas sp.]|nr:MAG: 23S rRNA (guanosine(2251)-2'-O)-methyltransferase RlmB [Nitrosomonas sp.]